jgi:hypothetical protein
MKSTGYGKSPKNPSFSTCEIEKMVQIKDSVLRDSGFRQAVSPFASRSAHPYGARPAIGRNMLFGFMVAKSARTAVLMQDTDSGCQ